MVDPVPSGIRGEGKVTYGISVDFVIESEEDAEARMCARMYAQVRGECDSMKVVLLLSQVAPMSSTP
jgi:hypothetical protein